MGRKLSEWGKDLISSTVGTKHQEAVDAVRHIGPKALPLALRLCQANDSALDEMLRESMVRWCNVHIPYVDENWRLGLEIIKVLGTNAKPAIPKLIGFLKGSNPNAADNAAVAFGYIGVDAIPPLMALLTNESLAARGYAAWGLGCIGSPSCAAMPILLRYINDKDEVLRFKAAWALTKINDEPSIVVPALIKYIKNENYHSSGGFIPHSWLFYTLGRFGTNALPAVPALTSYIESRPFPEYEAMAALYRIDPETGKDFVHKYEVQHRNFNASNFINSLETFRTITPASSNSGSQWEYKRLSKHLSDQ